MQRALFRLAGTLERHRIVAVAAWLALVVVALPFALRQSENLTGSGFGVPGSGSDAVRIALERDFPETGGAQLAVVLDARGGGEDALARAVRALPARLQGVDAVSVPRLVAPLASGPTAIVPLRVAVGDDRAPDVASTVRERLDVGESRDGLVAHVIGLGAYVDATADVLEDDVRAAEAIGFPAVLVILFVAFGSLAAAALPVSLAIVSITLTGALIFAVSQVLDVYLFAVNLASLVGIGVAVDYSLFVLVRYREERRAGHDAATARARALATSGLATIFSGITVIIALGAIWTVDSAALRSLALGAILVVAVSVVVAVSLLPVLLALLERRIGSGLRPAAPLRRRRPGHAVAGSDWQRWTATVTRHPVRALLASAVLLLVLAAPALWIDIRSGILDQLPRDHEAREGARLAASAAGPGASGHGQVVVRTADGSPSTLIGRARAVEDQISAEADVASTAAPVVSQSGNAALITFVPRRDPEAAASKALVERLRSVLPTVAGAGATVHVGGVSATQHDYEAQIRGSLGRLLVVVLVLCFVVLVVLLRSVVVPLKAVAVNLLSVGAAYGVVVLVFQWGVLDGPLGLDTPGHVDPTVPPILLALVFGLSMDYEVFLLSRIRERYEATGDSRRAVADGLASSAASITSAAAIMVAVFAAFVATGVPAIQMMGLGGAIAVALDATLVRLVLVPATMTLLGDRNWWLPGPLDRVLPGSFEQLPEAARSV